MKKPSISHEAQLIKELRDNSDFAEEYLKAAIEDSNNPKVLLVALRQLAEAKGGVAKVAKKAGIERESLYRALSKNGNPRFDTLYSVLKAVGFRLSVSAC